MRQRADRTSGAPSSRWAVSFVVFRVVALLFALVGFADLLFFGGEYQRASASFHTHYQAANWSLVILAFYPRRMFRLSRLLIVPFVLVSLVAAYEWNWLSRNEVLSVASGEGALKNVVALLALGFVIESLVAIPPHNKSLERTREG